jgi:hypothetical protein
MALFSSKSGNSAFAVGTMRASKVAARLGTIAVVRLPLIRPVAALKEVILIALALGSVGIKVLTKLASPELAARMG